MGIRTIDGSVLREMLKAGSTWLYKHKDAVDSLNVFPVPDGDTGSNMYMTVAAASKEADKVTENSVSKVAAAAALGALMGARGNSGVILSQFYRGLSKGFEGLDEADVSDVAKAFTEAANTAYKAVMRPVEGTILTVGREVARGAAAKARVSNDILDVLDAALEEGNRALEKTPEMLPALKDAGVVDAGGKGLLTALQGGVDYLRASVSATGKITEFTKDIDAPPGENQQSAERKTGITEAEDILFTYCTEFLVKGTDLSADDIKRELEGHGDSLLVVGTSDVVKIHVHTNNPGLVLDYAVKLGSLSEIQINNMKEQNLRAAAENTGGTPGDSVRVRKKPIAVVSVTVGDGLVDIFKSLGVDYVVQGGQTMNPSIEELKRAVESTGGESVVILPNNSNVILTAQQVSQLTHIPVTVIPTKTIPEGLGAMLAFSADADIADNAREMEKAAGVIRTGEITYAVRDSRYNGLEIKAGNFIGLVDGEIAIAGDRRDDIALSVIQSMYRDNCEIITLFYGADVSADDAESFADRVRDAFPDADIELQYGGQPLYFYIISVE